MSLLIHGVLLLGMGIFLCVLLRRSYKTQNQFLVGLQEDIKEIKEELYVVQIQGEENFHRLKESIEGLQTKKGGASA